MKLHPKFASLAAFAVACASPLIVHGAPGKALTEVEAKQRALAMHPGKVVEVEDEKLRGTPVFSVEIKTENGTREVKFRKSDGAVLEDSVSQSGDESDHEGEK